MSFLGLRTFPIKTVRAFILHCYKYVFYLISSKVEGFCLAADENQGYVQVWFNWLGLYKRMVMEVFTNSLRVRMCAHVCAPVRTSFHGCYCRAKASMGP